MHENRLHFVETFTKLGLSDLAAKEVLANLEREKDYEFSAPFIREQLISIVRFHEH